MNEMKKKYIGLQRTWISKRTVSFYDSVKLFRTHFTRHNLGYQAWVIKFIIIRSTCPANIVSSLCISSCFRKSWTIIVFSNKLSYNHYNQFIPIAMHNLFTHSSHQSYSIRGNASHLAQLTQIYCIPVISTLSILSCCGLLKFLGIISS